MTPERFEDLLDAFDAAEGEDELAELREHVLDDIEEAKRLLADGESKRAEQLLDEALGTARGIVDDGDPQETGSVTRGSGPRRSPPDAEDGYRVVIADDNSTRRSLHRTLLEEAGPFEVVAETDRRILDAVRARAPDLVLVDVATPEEQRLRSIAKLGDVAPEVDVAVLPAFEDEEFAARARDSGADLYLAKDLGGAELVDRLHQLLADGG